MQNHLASNIIKSSFFKELPIHSDTLSALAKLGIERMTNIQEKVMPHVLSGGNAHIGAETGSGKSLLYLLPMMEKLMKKRSSVFPTAVVLVPTMELSFQAHSMITTFLENHAQLSSNTNVIVSNAVQRYDMQNFKENLELAKNLCRGYKANKEVERTYKSFYEEFQKPDVCVMVTGRLFKDFSVDDINFWFKHVELVAFDEFDIMMKSGHESELLKSLFNYLRKKKVKKMSPYYTKEEYESLPTLLQEYSKKYVDQQLILTSATVLKMLVKKEEEISRSEKLKSVLHPIPYFLSDKAHVTTLKDHAFLRVGVDSDDPADVFQKKIKEISKEIGQQATLEGKRNVLVFVNSANIATAVSEKLSQIFDVSAKDSIQILCYHGGINPYDRLQMLKLVMTFYKEPKCDSNVHITLKSKAIYKDGLEPKKVNVLVTTDAVARGIDFADTHLIVQFDFPRGAVEYIHRVGRSGRTNKVKGKVINFVSPSDEDLASAIELRVNSNIEEDLNLQPLFSSNRAFRKRVKASITEEDDDSRDAWIKKVEEFETKLKNNEYPTILDRLTPPS
ncbi:P-loop containing nucleoside triphosphate hydrolase protein [Rozella allomycis CSF55]|uniref:RNA helicase n=1 Tax=Rozella allomycis (strain CSF55) TaxID=988480 RepID=A0A4P9YK98_ROZAC|nr:P-loop containing nucleoside triphosphate hydrolase protein [Rozella allomycis CSF55]